MNHTERFKMNPLTFTFNVFQVHLLQSSPFNPSRLESIVQFSDQ